MKLAKNLLVTFLFAELSIVTVFPMINLFETLRQQQDPLSQPPEQVSNPKQIRSLLQQLGVFTPEDTAEIQQNISQKLAQVWPQLMMAVFTRNPAPSSQFDLDENEQQIMQRVFLSFLSPKNMLTFLRFASVGHRNPDDGLTFDEQPSEIQERLSQGLSILFRSMQAGSLSEEDGVELDAITQNLRRNEEEYDDDEAHTFTDENDDYEEPVQQKRTYNLRETKARRYSRGFYKNPLRGYGRKRR